MIGAAILFLGYSYTNYGMCYTTMSQYYKPIV